MVATIRVWARRFLIATVAVAIVLALVAPVAFERLATATGERLGHAVEVMAVSVLNMVLRTLEPVLPLLIIFFGFRVMMRGVFGGGGQK